ncbi:MAG: hypothetical protein IJS37_05975 [Bacilli bacterium]|nr:hypothetical protein [Bacilli bacterium]
MNNRLFVLPLLLLLTACSSGNSSTASSSLVSSDESSLVSSEVTSLEPSTEAPTVQVISMPVKEWIIDEQHASFLWQWNEFPRIVTDHLDIKTLFPGDIVTLRYEGEPAFFTDAVGGPIFFEGTTRFVSVDVTKGTMVEVDVKDGVPQYEKAGLDLSSIVSVYRITDYAVTKTMEYVPASTLEKVYVGVSAEEPTVPLGVLSYAFR